MYVIAYGKPVILSYVEGHYRIRADNKLLVKLLDKVLISVPNLVLSVVQYCTTDSGLS